MAAYPRGLGLMFALGVFLASIQPLQRIINRHPMVGSLNNLILNHYNKFHVTCNFDAYRIYPVNAVRSLDNEDEIPSNNDFPGLSHKTVSGRVHHGNREIEMWFETLQPGHGTPIHSHDCEEIFLITKGTGVVKIAHPSKKSVFTQPLSANSTVTILPNAIHQLFNDGKESLSFVVSISNPPLRPTMYESWEGVAGNKGKAMSPLPWDTICTALKPNLEGVVQSPIQTNEAAGNSNKKSEL